MPGSSQQGFRLINEEVVKTLAGIEGLSFPEERLPAIAQRLRDMHEMAADLDSVDVSGEEPAVRFDPTWPNGGAA